MISGNASARAIRASICLGFMILGSIPTLGASTSATTELARYRASAEGASAGESRTAAQVEELSSALPMGFEPNVGQADSRARFVARSRGYGVFLTDSGAVLSLPISRPGGQDRASSSASKRDELSSQTEVAGVAAVRMRFYGARPEVRAVCEDELPGKVNYLRGNDSGKWQRDVPTFARVRYEGVYDGIDAVFHGTQQMLEYDVVVHPGADPSLVRVRFDGQDSADVTADGDLVLRIGGGGELRHLRPGVFQLSGAGKRPVSARYELDGDGSIRFAVGEYDRSRPLVIDPGFVFVASIGAAISDDISVAVATDAAGAAYVAGMTNAYDFPTTPGAFDPGSALIRGRDAFVAKVSSTGSSLVYATYLAGENEETPMDIGIDALGSAYICGKTSSLDFPTTVGAFQTTASGLASGFLTKLSPSGSSLGYSTFLSGSSSDSANGLVVDVDGSCYVAGDTGSTDFPTTPGAFDTSYNGPGGSETDAFVLRINAAGSALAFSTFLGGYNYEVANDIAVDATGVYVCGGTFSSPDFPVTPGAFDTSYNVLSSGSMPQDAFVAKFSLSGATLVYATYLGGYGHDEAASLGVGAGGEVVVCGNTENQAFPRTAGAYSSPTLGYFDTFVVRFTAAGNGLVYSALFGGTGYEICTAAFVRPSGAVALTGITASSDLPTTSGALDRSHNGGYDGFLARLSPNGTSLEFASFFGTLFDDSCEGLVVDGAGKAVVVGYVGGPGFSTTAGAFDRSYGDGRDGFVVRLTAGGGAAEYSTFIGGNSTSGSYVGDSIEDVAVDGVGAIFVTGTTFGRAFPVTAGSFDVSLGNDPIDTYSTYADGFVSKLSPDGLTLLFSTYLGGRQEDYCRSLAIAPDGGVLVGGFTQSADFPTTPTGFSVSLAGYSDGFVVKLSPAGSSMTFGTYIGGAGYEVVNTLAVDSAGSVFAAGTTTSQFFPTTPGAYDTTFNGYDVEDGFVTKLTSDGSQLAYSTYIGGAGRDIIYGMAIDQAGAVYVGGSTASPNFPTTPGALDSTFDGTPFEMLDSFASKLSATGTALVYSTYFGGTRAESVADVAVDPVSGIATIVGYTSSADFPTTPGALDTTLGDGIGYGQDAFVARLNAVGSALVFSTYLGGNSTDAANGVVIDAAGRPVVAGMTTSADFPTSADAADAVFSDGGSSLDGFSVRLDAAGGSLAYGTFVGGSNDDLVHSLALGPGDTTLVVGQTGSASFVTSGFGGFDTLTGFVAKIAAPQPLSKTSAGVYTGASGAWFLRNSNTPGPADMTFSYGPGGSFTPIVGDWDGDGDDTAGIYDPATGAFFLRNTNANGGADLVFTFGAGGAGIVALSGDWNGDGVDTIGLYVVATGVFFLRNSNSSGPADAVFTFGAGGAGIIPIVGDWNGDGSDTIGLYIAGSGTFFLRNANAPGGADLAFSYGPAGAAPVCGDWNGDGTDTIGIYVPATGAWFLRNANSPGSADVVFSYGPAGVTPIVGNWDGV